ncbi:hypothetical protein ACLMAJ_28620 [Nocardia sp. KC 131]|uniref:hypothetical protein n=1 Tax=Nocardia arseniciresistens TaxID=3392119 RepID=UPI00398EB731
MIELPGIDDVDASDSCNTTDSARLNQLIEYVTANPSHAILTDLLAADHMAGARDPLWERCVFDHCAVMLFPANTATLHRQLIAAGLQVGATVPSVVVQQRVCARYELDPDAYRIHILQAYRRAPNPGRDQRIEIFFPSTSSRNSLVIPMRSQRARDDEQRHNRETHFAFVVRDLDLTTYLTMRHHLAQVADMIPDGGGFNPHDRNHGAGCSTFYFAGPGSVGAHPWPRRLELVCGGRQDSALLAHRTEG